LLRILESDKSFRRRVGFNSIDSETYTFLNFSTIRLIIYATINKQLKIGENVLYLFATGFSCKPVEIHLAPRRYTRYQAHILVYGFIHNSINFLFPVFNAI